jgi:hypothetical protein
MNPEIAILWGGAIATLGVYTILYRENPVSRLFEHIFVGLSAGYLIVFIWTQNLEGRWWKPMIHEGRWYWVFAPVVGLLFYFIYSRRLLWLARLVMGLFFGIAASTPPRSTPASSRFARTRRSGGVTLSCTTGCS